MSTDRYPECVYSEGLLSLQSIVYVEKKNLATQTDNVATFYDALSQEKLLTVILTAVRPLTLTMCLREFRFPVLTRGGQYL